MSKPLYAKPTGRKTLENRISDVLEFIPDKAHSLLDIGCAKGEIMLALKDRFELMVGIDTCSERVRAAEIAIANSPHISVKCADIDTMPIGVGYDYVLLLGVLQHLQNNGSREHVLGKCLQAAKKKLIVRAPIKETRAPRRSLRQSLKRRIRGKGDYFTELSMVSRLAKKHGFSITIIDNSYRKGDQKRQDLLILEKLENV